MKKKVGFAGGVERLPGKVGCAYEKGAALRRGGISPEKRAG